MNETWPLLSILVWLPILGGVAVMLLGDDRAALGRWLSLGIAIAAFGGALGQSKAIAAGLEGIARNPSADKKIFTPMIIGLALIESLVIYALVISFLLIGKL
jgi:F-type H+-transporting ATPase subunit c